MAEIDTDCIHAGQPPDPRTGAVMVPVSFASTFAQASPGDFKEFEYSRTDNPTRQAFEKCIAAIENCKHGIAFASGSAATGSILHMLKTGEQVVAHHDLYGGTNRFFRRVAAPYASIDFKLIDMTSLDNVKNTVSASTKLVWLESPSNPTLTVLDIAEICKITRAQAPDAIIVVDNTFLSPYFQRPIDLGADMVLHSVSKYINGHSDVVMGIVLLNSDELKDRLRFVQNGLGAIPGPMDCYLAMRGVKTLHLRMERSASTAMRIATMLEHHPKVEKVLYPGLKSHPQHEIAAKQQRGYGAMITMFTKGGLEQARTFLENVKLFTLAESLGGVESLIEHPAIMTHASVPPEQRKVLGISDSLIRVSVGIENADQLEQDMQQALDAVKL